MKYRVGVTTRIINTKEYEEIRDALSHDLIDYFISQDALPVLIPNSLKLSEKYLSNIDMLFLSGGNTVSCELNSDSEDFSLSKIRDDVESNLVEKALEKKIPIIGICRGMQFLNNYFGGSLKELEYPNEHTTGNHYVEFNKDNVFSVSNKKTKVNSFHNFVIDRLGNNLEILALSEDGLVEAFKHFKYPVYGMMWHPERRNYDDARLLNNQLFNNIISSK
tara:strand:- start:332 stop:991 length:660 start_codon:yes stop_codon:yes gene_type:complete